MLFDIVIIEVAEYLQLIPADLVVKGRITAPSFLFRIGTRERIKVKPRQNAASNPAIVRNVRIGRCQTVRVGSRSSKYVGTRARWYRSTCGCSYRRTNAKVPWTGVGALKRRYQRIASVSIKCVVMVIVKDVTGNGYLVITNAEQHVRFIGTG